MSDQAQSKPLAVVPARLELEKRAERTRRVEVELPYYLPARMLNEFVYCPRLFFYEWVEGIFRESADTIEGETQHRRVDKEGGSLPAPQDLAEDPKTQSITLSSERLKVIAKMDVVQVENGNVRPIDYKKGRPQVGPDGPG